MITGKFVSCYSCAGEGSDQNYWSVRGVDRGRAGFQVKYLVLSKQSRQVPELEAQVLYSLIIFQNYTAVTFKIQSWGGFSGEDGGGHRFGADEVTGWMVEEEFWEASTQIWVASTINWTVTLILLKKLGKWKEMCMLKCPEKSCND